jgi:type IV pilus assembly protein PilY1
MASLLQNTRIAGICAMTALLISAAGMAGGADEPSMAEYTHYPLFQTGAVAPRIMLILDNSGSMNFPAYGDGAEDWPEGGEIEAPYKGSSCQQFATRVAMSSDDGQEQKNTGEIILCNFTNTLTLFDLDLGRDDDSYGNPKCAEQEAVIVATRFTDVAIPREVDGVPVVISSAYIEFTAARNNGGKKFRNAAITLKITAEATDSPATLGLADYNISNRPDTTSSATWSMLRKESWIPGETYQTPDLTTIVQELISRPGWQNGNAMLFKIEGGDEYGGRTAWSFFGNSSKAARLVIEYEPCEVQTYYGYFDSRDKPAYPGDTNWTKYSYGSGVFVRDKSGPWSGNFLNFIAMRRGDILRKALVGGLSTSRTGGGNATQIGIVKPPGLADYKKHHTGSGVSPWPDAWYFIEDGNIVVHESSSSSSTVRGTFTIKVEKDIDAEPDDFGDDGELAGVLQKVGDRAEWGNAWFTSGDVNDGKGEIDAPMGSNMTSMITTIKNKPFNTSTPIAEALYVVTQYFKQEDAESGLNYANNAISPFNPTRDPYVSKDDNLEACAQGFCILLTDGMSTNDQRIPTYLRGYDTENLPTEYFPSNGTSYARDVALYMRTTDLRSDTVGKDELDGTQNILLYVIYAMGNNDDARRLLQQTAINGGFYDSDNNSLPNLQSEWDKDNDTIPDNYFEAQDGAKLEKKLMNAILAILQRAGSGTAVSVLATKGEGEGTLVQAIFNPSVATLEGEVQWTGLLHSLWVDDHGKIREDTVADYRLNPDEDERIEFSVNEKTGDTVIMRYKNDAEEPYDPSIQLEYLRSIWSAGGKLAERDPIFRKIYTYKGDGTEADPNENFFQVNNNYYAVLGILNYLGINDDATWSYLGESEWPRGFNLMQWISGLPDHDSSYYGTVNLRLRTLNDGRLWKLGDIIHSTPTSMAQPLADYDLLYSDQSYYDFYIKNRNRETVVFVGSNAGMLHAFTGWVYQEDTFVSPYEVDGYFTDHSDATENDVDIGDELWAYIPQSVLPHLKWLADPNYSHVNFIDLRPRIFDAKIFEPSDLHPNGWGSVLVCGLGFAAGMEIPVNPNHANAAKRLTMYPTFFAFDVTNPRAPVLLWERSFPNLGMASNYPNLLKVEEEWLLAIGSGPTSMKGDSKQDASLFVVDLKTGGNTAQGGLKNIFTLPGGDAFTNSPVAFDKSMNYSVDAVYVAANYNDQSSEMFRLTIPQKDSAEFKPWGADGDPPEYIPDPTSPNWTITKLFKSPRPITGSASLSVDRQDNAWLYFGTGRYLNQTDKSSDDQNYIIGIKDPFFNPDLEDCNYTYPSVECEINKLTTADNALTDLFDADEYTVYGRSEVEGPEGKVTFDDLVTEARRNVYQGWYRHLLRTEGSPSERVVNKGAVLGGVLLMPTFTPSTDPCGFGGTSRLFGVYYETGTAFFRKVFQQDTGEGPIMDVIDLGDGLASSLSMHSGRQSGGKVYVQKSTGEIIEVDVAPAFNIKSGPEYWLDDGYY